jgi:hypothetical protein
LAVFRDVVRRRLAFAVEGARDRLVLARGVFGDAFFERRRPVPAAFLVFPRERFFREGPWFALDILGLYIERLRPRLDPADPDDPNRAAVSAAEESRSSRRFEAEPRAVPDLLR